MDTILIDRYDALTLAVQASSFILMPSISEVWVDVLPVFEIGEKGRFSDHPTVNSSLCSYLHTISKAGKIVDIARRAETFRVNAVLRNTDATPADMQDNSLCKSMKMFAVCFQQVYVKYRESCIPLDTMQFGIPSPHTNARAPKCSFRWSICRVSSWVKQNRGLCRSQHSSTEIKHHGYSWRRSGRLRDKLYVLLGWLNSFHFMSLLYSICR